MGTWNATCGITQLPITEGARVVLIPLVVKQQDFMARDSLAGSGCCDNNLIAQPIALPIYGTYDSTGGVNVEDDDRGLVFFREMLEELVAKGKLLREKSAKPVLLKKLSKDFFEEMLRGRLFTDMPNVRKKWLADLKQTIAEHGDGDGKGFEHYQAQLSLDPATMPDMIQFALGAMLVPRELYDGLCQAMGAEEAYGYFDEKENKMVTFEGSREAELHDHASINAEQRVKVEETFTAFAEGVASGELSDLQGTQFMELLPLACVQQAVSVQHHHLFFQHAGKAALKASVLKDDVGARTLWVQMMLFCSAMGAMRKQWTVQAGAGNSNGLEEGTAALYQVTANFLNKTLADQAQCEAEAASDD